MRGPGHDEQPARTPRGREHLSPHTERDEKVAISVYHTTANGTADTVPEGSQWFESYLESTDGGATFSALETVDPTVVKTGPICTQGTGCSGDRELLDFQSDTIDNPSPVPRLFAVRRACQYRSKTRG